jgi:hypothetical protein
VTSRPMGEYEMDGEACWFVDQARMQVRSPAGLANFRPIYLVYIG